MLFANDNTKTDLTSSKIENIRLIVIKIFDNLDVMNNNIQSDIENIFNKKVTFMSSDKEGTVLGFLKLVRNGDYEEAQELLQDGLDVNSRHPKSLATALHLAGSGKSRELVDILAEHDDLDYLVRDAKGRLPSALAFEIANDPELGELLIAREVAQAKERGIDYRELVVSSDLTKG